MRGDAVSELAHLQSTAGNRAIAQWFTAGRPLDPPTRRVMESRFGLDFSAVHVHDDARAAATAAGIHAAAFTVGQDIVFGAGRYAPATGEGRELLAHELAHTVQQRGARSEAPPVARGSALETQAEQAGRAVAGGEAPAQSLGQSGLAVARQAVGADDERSDDDVRMELVLVAQSLRLFEQRGRLYSDTAAGVLRQEREDPGFWDDFDRVASRFAVLQATLVRRSVIAEATAAANQPEEPEQEDQPQEVPMALSDEETSGSASAATPQPPTTPAAQAPPSRVRAAVARGPEQAANARFLPGGFTDAEMDKLVAESKEENWRAIQAQERAEAEKARELDEKDPDPFVWGYVLNESGTSDRVQMRRSQLEAAQDRARNRSVLATMESIGAAGPVTTAGLVVGGTARVMRGGESKDAVPSALAFGILGDALALGVGGTPFAHAGASPGPEPPAIVEQAAPREPMEAPDPVSSASATGPTSPSPPPPEPAPAGTGTEPIESGARTSEPQPGRPAPGSAPAGGGPQNVHPDVEPVHPPVGPAAVRQISGITSDEVSVIGRLSPEAWDRVFAYARTNSNVYSVKGKLAEELFGLSPEFGSIRQSAVDRAASEGIPPSDVQFVPDIRGVTPTTRSAGGTGELTDGAFVAISGGRVRVLAVIESKSPSNLRELVRRPEEWLGQVGWDFERMRQVPTTVRGTTYQPSQVDVSRTRTEWVGVAPPGETLSTKGLAQIRSGFPTFRLVSGPVRDPILNQLAARVVAQTTSGGTSAATP